MTIPKIVKKVKTNTDQIAKIQNAALKTILGDVLFNKSPAVQHKERRSMVAADRNWTFIKLKCTSLFRTGEVCHCPMNAGGYATNNEVSNN